MGCLLWVFSRNLTMVFIRTALYHWHISQFHNCIASSGCTAVKTSLWSVLSQISIQFITLSQSDLHQFSTNYDTRLHAYRTYILNSHTKKNQGKSEGFDSCDRPSNLTQIGSNWSIFRPCDLKIWWMTLKNNKARLLYYINFCASFQIHQWIQTGVTVRKHPIWVKFDDFLSCVTLQFDVWPWKTIGHLFYATSSFVHHFVAIGDFKLEIQSRNAQFGSKSTIFRAMWPCNLTYDLEKQLGISSMLLQALCIIL